ncbi:DUF4144 family protein [Vibrio sonorensis]|uniref:DUF4144 family protein n=1 Tax=Vibrio sonorensis TaxID=1004316 RepID=UPI0008DA532B|nr:DUF4144 family protein [Vibrio sonorensis]
MIKWPCMLKLHGDPELIYINTQASLAAELDGLIWGEEDYLIDCDGECFVVHSSSQGFWFETRGNHLSLQSVTELIQEHEFAKAEVCLTKIQFSSIEDAIKAIAL